MAQPHHRHQASLESVLDFSSTTASLSADERSQATLIFHRIINYCSSHELLNTSGDAGRKYGRAKLVRLLYEYAISDAGRDNILRYFLASMVMRGGYGILGDIIVGIVGAFLGGFLASLLGLGASGFIGTVIIAFIGSNRRLRSRCSRPEAL